MSGDFTEAMRRRVLPKPDKMSRHIAQTLGFAAGGALFGALFGRVVERVLSPTSIDHGEPVSVVPFLRLVP